MDNLLYIILTKYFMLLSKTGYKNYKDVYKLVVFTFLYDIMNNEFTQDISDSDKDLITNLMNCLNKSTCEFPNSVDKCC